MPDSRETYDLTWPRKDQAVLTLLCVGAGIILAATASYTRVGIGSDIPVNDRRIAAATETIDPNVAAIPSLRRLPGIGPKIAAAIVDYRLSQGGRPFATTNDLQKVRGIGPITVQRIAPFIAITGDQDRLGPAGLTDPQTPGDLQEDPLDK